MAWYVSDYICTCNTCNRLKTFLQKPAGLLNPNKVPEQRWGIVIQDLVTFPTEANGYNMVWVAVDQMTKRVRVALTSDRVTMAGIAKLFRNNIWKNHSLLDMVISDRDPCFLADFSRELNSLLRINTRQGLYSLPPPDGWPDRKGQPGLGGISPCLHQHQANGLARMAPYV